MGGTYQTDEKIIGRSYLSKFLEVRDHFQGLGIDVKINIAVLNEMLWTEHTNNRKSVVNTTMSPRFFKISGLPSRSEYNFIKKECKPCGS
jgi:hypothetical protein